MKIVFIRHLPTPGNEKRQYIGCTDEHLSETAVKAFRNRAYTYPDAQYIIASPMKRCIETARLIYPDAEIKTEPMLRECDFGLFEGKTYEELKEHPAYIEWLESGGTTAFPGGEAQEVFRERCAEGVRKWISLLAGERVDSAAFIVHGGTIMAALSQMAEEPCDFYHWQVKNGGGFTAEVPDEKWMRGEYTLRNVKRMKSC